MLDALAAGVVRDRTALRGTARTLNGFCIQGITGCELTDTVSVLEAMATGETIVLDEVERRKAAKLAALLRALASA
ncbi:MAG: hypothetical protein ACREU2_13940 [Steroidobacteraceae bacterium]